MSVDIISTHIINNLIEVMVLATQNARHSSAGCEKLVSSLRYFTGCEFPFFNGVFNNYDQNSAQLIANLEKTTAFFTEQQTPFIWWWTEQTEIPANIKASLDANGFQFVGDFLGIAADLNKMQYGELGDLIELGVVETDQEYQYFLDIICTVFQMSESIKSDLKFMYKSYGPQEKFKHYLGYYAGEPVATLTSYIDGSVVGLYNGATLPQFQKHGLCTALAEHALKEALSAGCQSAVSQLMAPGMAKGLSEKMGAQTHCRLLPFIKDPRIRGYELIN